MPLFPETIRDIRPKADGNGKTDYFRWVYAILLIASDAVGGYVFARTASNQGMPISNKSAACSAGAAFGAITFISRAITGCIAMIRITSATKVSDIFGVYEVIVPEPMYVTQDEYAKMQEGIHKLFRTLFVGTLAKLPAAAVRMARFVACCLPCCCPCWRRKIRRSMRNVVGYLEQAEEEMDMNIREFAESEDMASFERMIIGTPVPDDEETANVTDRLLPRQCQATYGAIGT